MSECLFLPLCHGLTVIELRDPFHTSALASVITMLRDVMDEQGQEVALVDYDHMAALGEDDESAAEFSLESVVRSIVGSSPGAAVVTVTGNRGVAARLRRAATAAFWVDSPPKELTSPPVDPEPALIACDVRDAVGDRWKPFSTWAMS